MLVGGRDAILLWEGYVMLVGCYPELSTQVATAFSSQLHLNLFLVCYTYLLSVLSVGKTFSLRSPIGWVICIVFYKCLCYPELLITSSSSYRFKLELQQCSLVNPSESLYWYRIHALSVVKFFIQWATKEVFFWIYLSLLFSYPESRNPYFP